MAACSSGTRTIGEDEWIEVNKQLLKELGPDAYLRRLLDALKAESRSEHYEP